MTMTAPLPIPTTATPRGPRRRPRSPARVAALGLGLAAVSLAACSDGMQVASVHVKSGSIGPAGGTLVVTSADSTELAGTSIRVPAGAVDGATLIAIGFSDANLALDDARGSGPTLYFEPIGLDLHAAATITIPFDKDVRADRLRVRTLAGGEVRDVTARVTHVDTAASLVTFDLDRLGHVQPQTIALDPPDAPCNDPTCQDIDAGCLLGACPTPDAGVPIDAGGGGSCPLVCPPGTQCNPAQGQCIATCGLLVCPAGQGCNADTVCVNQCGSGGAITFLCPVDQVCNFANGTCHP